LDLESRSVIVSRYFEAVAVVLRRHGATIERFIGDALMAVFGVPLLHEDDALRAVRAAGELRVGMAALNRGLEREFGTRLELQIGVDTGEVVTEPNGRLVTGDVVNGAGRLQRAAAPGEILLGPETLILTRDVVTVEEVETFELASGPVVQGAHRL